MTGRQASPNSFRARPARLLQRPKKFRAAFRVRESRHSRGAPLPRSSTLDSISHHRTLVAGRPHHFSMRCGPD